MVFMTVLKSERTDSFSLESNSVDLYPGIPGDTKKEVVPTQIMHSAGFSDQNVDAWLNSDEAKNFRTYIEKTHHDKKITLLPSPIR
jgi:hypothetical protein